MSNLERDGWRFALGCSAVAIFSLGYLIYEHYGNWVSALRAVFGG